MIDPETFGPPPFGTLCSLCQIRQVVGGTMYQSGEDVIAVHFCAECEPRVPVGFAEWRQAEQTSERSPRDPLAICDRCGSSGTIARLTRVTDVVRETNYCRLCWPQVRRELDREEEERRSRWQTAAEARQRDRRAGQYTPPPRPERNSITWSSSSWDDTRELLEMLSQTVSQPGHVAACAEAARGIQARAPDMDGPMPPDIAKFVREHSDTAV